MAYKPGTEVVEESAGLRLAEAAARRGSQVTVCDPAALDGARARLGDRVRYQSRPGPWLRDQDVIVLATAWPQFRPLRADHLRRRGAQTIIDCWSLWAGRRLPPNVRYLAPGRSAT
jgi:UDPglucose 6-dehydrogenase